ncbi:hypothetical protein DFH29DRAFT_1003813 [Suillus ampliporus]|nr:hypothetical protein DFH29DRAFT_1003813 [Suillus ampliporus]
MLPQPVSTTSYRKRLFGSVTTANVLPEPRNKSIMDKVLEQEFVGKVLWEEKSLPQDAESIMDTIILDTNFTSASLGKIHYFMSGPGEKKVKGGQIFHPASRGAGGMWQLDKRNVQPKLLVNTRNNKKQKGQVQKAWGAQKTQPRMQMSMVAAALTNTEVEVLDSSFTSPQTDKSFGAKGYDEKNPNKKWPQASVTTEGKWTLLFNAMQAAMHTMYAKSYPNPSAAFPFCPMDVTSSLPKRIWSSQFSNTPVLDNTNAQKPDIILVDCSLCNLSLRWCNIITCMEHTESELNPTIPLYFGSATKGIACNKLRLHYFDRSGLIISRPVSIVTDSVRLLEVLNTLTLTHTSTLGYDPTMHMCDPTCKDTHINLRENTIGWIEGPDNAHLSIMSVLWQSQGFFSRGTVCYRIQTSDGLEYALKDCWVAEDRKNHEVTVLRMVDGIPNVVRLVADWDVLYDGEPDCTYHIRASHGVCSSGFIRRFHQRLLLTPCGEPLLSYSSKPELLRAFHDFVKAHGLMLGRHILHGDLSPNNFVIHDGQGYFIDFDHARIIAQGTDSVPSEGTALYVEFVFSGRMLPTKERMKKIKKRSNTQQVMTWSHYFTSSSNLQPPSTGPCGIMRDEDRRPMWVENFENAGSDLWMAKKAYVLSPPNDKSLMEKTALFFASFSQIIQEWRHLILAAASNTSNTPIGITHAALVSLLAKWISQLPTDAPAEIIVPMASSLRLGHPPHDDAQSSTGPRRSMRIQQRVL